MVAVFNKQLLSWYLITLKLNQTLEPGLQNSQSPTTSRSIELPEALQNQNQETQPLRSIRIIDEYTGPNEEDKQPEQESQWVISIREKLDQAQHDDAAGCWAKLSIYRIPQCLRDAGDDKAYIPQIVSLGPYHHGKKRLRSMERHKWRALHRILKRANQQIELYLDAVRELEERTRNCYEGNFSMNSNDFVEMMVLDCCFVLELFRGAAEGFTQIGYSRNDPIFAMRSIMHLIQRDMIMLENQIPLFLLDRVFGLQFGKPNQQGAVARLALRFFDPLTPTDEPLTKSDRSRLESSIGNSSTFDPLSDQGGLHCLEVFRRNLLVVRAGPKPTPRLWRKRWSHTARVADKRRLQLIHSIVDP